MISLAELEAAARIVHAAMPPTPQYSWPLLNRRAGCETWVKHENHTPTGAFKVRGGLVRIAALERRSGGVISATRGNHGQSLAYACARNGVRCIVVVPAGNSPDKNAAMQAFGAELIEHGRDFDEARLHAGEIARERDLVFIGPFERELVAGVGTYALEFLRAQPDLDAVYAPIGCGSGICGLVSARDALGLRTEIIGVVASQANAYAQSFVRRQPVETATAHTMADGMAVRVPVPSALEVIWRGVADVVEVSEAEIEAAIVAYFRDTHNVAEGAGAAPLAALLANPRRRGGRYGLILSGGNIDLEVLGRVLRAHVS